MKIRLTTDDWQRLKTLRGYFLGDASENYWNTPRDLELYDLIYAQRIAWKWNAVLEDLITVGWRPCAENILDWGCGTGIASRTVAPWSNLQKVSLFDQSSLALSFAREKLLEQKREVIFFEKELPISPQTLILISHVLGELNDKELLELANRAATADEIIWVEPGSREISRRLSSIRKIFIEAGHHLIAPCVHQHSCPILEEKNQNEWCHFFAKPPTEIFQSAFWHETSRKLSIDLRSLPYSYLACSRAWNPSLATNVERLIGNPRILKAHCKLLCCGSSGLHEHILQKREHPELFRQIIKKGKRGLLPWKCTD